VAAIGKLTHVVIGNATAERAQIAAALPGTKSGEEKQMLTELGRILREWEPLHRPDSLLGVDSARVWTAICQQRRELTSVFWYALPLVPDDPSVWSAIALYIYRTPVELSTTINGSAPVTFDAQAMLEKARQILAEAQRRFPRDRKLHDRMAQVCEWERRPAAECLKILADCRGLDTCDVTYEARRLAYEAPHCEANNVRSSFALYTAKRLDRDTPAPRVVLVGDARYAIEEAPIVTGADVLAATEASTQIAFHTINDDVPDRYERYLALQIRAPKLVALAAELSRLAAREDGYLVAMNGSTPAGAMRAIGALSTEANARFRLYKTEPMAVCTKLTRQALP
jgi:hypothetical protein